MSTDAKFSFEDAVKHAAEKSILKIISEGGWVMPDYSNRVKIPADFVAGIWSLVDQDRIKRLMAERLEQELADRVMNHLAAEISTDIKNILSITERREALRAVARENIDRICNPSKS